jgi:hypothetical protein
MRIRRVVYKRKILITDKCSMTSRLQEMPHWREKCESSGFQVDRVQIGTDALKVAVYIKWIRVMSAKTKVTKTKTALKQIT